MKKQKLFSLLLAGACALTCTIVGGIEMYTQEADADWVDAGNNISYFTDMSSDGADLEYYDTLYNEDWKINGNTDTPLSGSWAMKDDTFISFSPSAKNTTGSFVWEFEYTCDNTDTVVIYPMCGGSWPATVMTQKLISLGGELKLRQRTT